MEEAGGMTDKQFNAYLRLLKSSLEDAKTEAELENKTDKLENIIKVLQRTIEDWEAKKIDSNQKSKAHRIHFSRP